MYFTKYHDSITDSEYSDMLDYFPTRSQDDYYTFIDFFNELIKKENKYTQAYREIFERSKDYKDYKPDNILTFERLRQIKYFEYHTMVLEEKELEDLTNHADHFLKMAYESSGLSTDYNTKRKVLTIDVDALSGLYYQFINGVKEYNFKRTGIKDEKYATIIEDQFIVYIKEKDIEVEVDGIRYGEDYIVNHILDSVMNVNCYIRPIAERGDGKYKSAANFHKHYITDLGKKRCLEILRKEESTR